MCRKMDRRKFVSSRGKRRQVPVILVFIFVKQGSHMLFELVDINQICQAVTSIEQSQKVNSVALKG